MHYFITLYRNKKIISIFGSFFSNKVKTKVQKVNGFWTFINVHFRKPEKSFEKGGIFGHL